MSRILDITFRMSDIPDIRFYRCILVHIPIHRRMMFQLQNSTSTHIHGRILGIEN